MTIAVSPYSRLLSRAELTPSCTCGSWKGSGDPPLRHSYRLVEMRRFQLRRPHYSLGLRCEPLYPMGRGVRADNPPLCRASCRGDERRVGATSAAFSPDGQSISVGFADGRVELWRIDASLDELLAWARRNRYVPELSAEQ